MRVQTIKATLTRPIGLSDAPYAVYIIREGDAVFYVGKAANPHNRLLSHLGLERTTIPSDVGAFIRKQMPRSASWHFEEYTLEECAPYIATYRATFSPDIQEFYQATGNTYDVDDAEEAVIKHYRPCFNVAMNPTPNPLPIQYSIYHSW